MSPDIRHDANAPPRTADLRAREPKAIHRALRVLEAVAEIGPGASAKQVSRALDYPTATTYRLLNLLVQDGYLVRMLDLKGFALGQRVADLSGYVTPPQPPQAIRDLLSELRGQVRAGVHLAMHERGRIVFVDIDPLFPLPFDPRQRITNNALVELIDPQTKMASTQDGRPARGLNGYFCLASAVRDGDGAAVAAIVLVAAVRGAGLDERVERLLKQYTDRLTPLMV